MPGIKDLHNVWRDALLPASFRGVEFHVELSTRASGRRTVVHEYPKRDLPYSEDMGRHAIRYAVTGYLIHGDFRLPDVTQQRIRLYQALEQEDAGTLMHPSLGPMLVMVERYSMTESKQKGGYFEFDMQFVEAGVPGLVPIVDTVGAVNDAAGLAEARASEIMNQILRSLNR